MQYLKIPIVDFIRRHDLPNDEALSEAQIVQTLWILRHVCWPLSLGMVLMG